ncbi:MAG: DNA-directed RNA polymerase subunit F [Candidatus Aenigmarchaeota archaeon]|nr:DNA-directed RNA polymerase subunit F [Candidatus Aenigmarchaeota archaeon]
MMEIVSEQIVTDSEAKELLEKNADGELKYEQKNAIEILRKFIAVPTDKIKALMEDLNKIEKLRDRHIISIVNFLPEDKEDLRVILHKEYATFTEDELNLILETVKKTV